MNYSTTQAIPWKTLHPWQRNQIIAEKIMGIMDFRCTGRLDYRGDNTMLRHRYYLCRQCQATLTVTDAWPERWMPQEHNKYIPHYSENTDAALTLLARCEGIVIDRRRQGQYRATIVHVGSEYEATMDSLGEAICVAALRAVGCEVEL